MATCGNCGKRDASVAEIRACYGAGVSDLGYASYAKDVKAEVAKPKPTITEGLWKLLDGSIYKVQASRGYYGGKAGNLYGKRLEVGPGDGGKPEASFVYAPGAMRLLADGYAEPLSAEDAAAFGKLYGICIRCSKDLTDERSIFAGYGQQCATAMGWPWGETS